MGRGVLITGTDTGVGKTLVACGLAALLRESGYRVGVLKPAETGCGERDGELFPRDAQELKLASGCEEPLERICPYRFREPLAPGVAADRRGGRIDIHLLQRIYEEISSAHDITLVEGAGGLLVPLLPHFTYAEFAGLLRVPLLVVAANRLGVINHLLLTLEDASCRGLKVIGYVLNRVNAQSSLAADTNREALAALTALPCVGEIVYVADLEARRASLGRLFREAFDLSLLNAFLPR